MPAPLCGLVTPYKAKAASASVRQRPGDVGAVGGEAGDDADQRRQRDQRRQQDEFNLLEGEGVDQESRLLLHDGGRGED